MLRFHQGSIIGIAQELDWAKRGRMQSQGGQAHSQSLTRSVGLGQDRDGDHHPIQRKAAQSLNRRNTGYEVLQVVAVVRC